MYFVNEQRNLDMPKSKKGIVLIGHGGVPTDFPRDNFNQLMSLHKNRKLDQPPSQTEIELEKTLREWPRSPENDPYKTGLEELADQLRTQVGDQILATAYNEFCQPTIAQAVEGLIKNGVTNIVLLTTMITPGGSHAEKEIPVEVKKLKAKHSKIEIKYAWPFDMSKVAKMLKAQIESACGEDKVILKM